MSGKGHKIKLLLIEDSPEVVSGITLTYKLRWPDAVVISTERGQDGIKAVETESPDLVILDINLPDTSGFQVLESIRSFSDVPVIILTVRDNEVDELRGLEMGADDYITKPFSPANLLTRCKAVLRRSLSGDLDAENLAPLVAGNIRINFANRELFVNDQRLHLTPNESRILFILTKKEGQVVSHETIKQQVWGSEAKFMDNSLIKRYIYQLRTKLQDSTESPRIIVSERSFGYRFIRPISSTG